MHIKPARLAGATIFFLGILSGLALASAAIWGDFEAMSYFYTGAGYDQFNGLKCPILMTLSDTGIVTAGFSNASDREIQPYYEVSVSGVASLREFEAQLPVPAHATESVQWTVDANDIDLGSFILVNVDVLPVAGYSTREATCGIVVLNLNGPTGRQIFGSVLAASLLGMVVGLGLLESATDMKNSPALNAANAMRATAIAAALAMLTGLMGWWLIGLIFCAVTILLLVVLLRFAAF